MRLLLDTHAFLWWDDGDLPDAVVELVQAADEVFVSAASAWEMSIKSALGKLKTNSSLAAAIADYGFAELPITMAHAEAVRALPMHHRDPFDRLLIAQARVETLALLTHDRALGQYDGLHIEWIRR
jgi:PIN domain nuclease of toxin-antitoxin system